MKLLTDRGNGLIVCPVCGTRFGVSHWSQRSQKYCSRRCSNSRTTPLQRINLKANRISIKAFDPVERGQQIATELTRRFPDLMAHLGRQGLTLQFGFSLDCGPLRFPIAIPALKILIDVDARYRRPNNYWPHAYRQARLEGWEIYDDQQAMGINAPLTQPGDAENTNVNLRTVAPTLQPVVPKKL